MRISIIWNSGIWRNSPQPALLRVYPTSLWNSRMNAFLKLSPKFVSSKPSKYADHNIVYGKFEAIGYLDIFRQQIVWNGHHGLFFLVRLHHPILDRVLIFIFSSPKVWWNSDHKNLLDPWPAIFIITVWVRNMLYVCGYTFMSLQT